MKKHIHYYYFGLFILLYSQEINILYYNYALGLFIISLTTLINSIYLPMVFKDEISFYLCGIMNLFFVAVLFEFGDKTFSFSTNLLMIHLTAAIMCFIFADWKKIIKNFREKCKANSNSKHSDGGAAGVVAEGGLTAAADKIEDVSSRPTKTGEAEPRST